MREVVFQLRVEQPGQLIAEADALAMRISAPNLEELHHEAREALIKRFGPAHATYQLRIRRRQLPPRSGIRPLGRPISPCGECQA
jgi:hypothetical protein